MGQDEIWEILSKKPNKYFSVKELSKAIGTKETSVSQTLVRMLKHEEVERKINHYKDKTKHIYYGYRIRKNGKN